MKKTEHREEEDFFGKIERKFNQLRGTPLLISPQDWGLMTEWKKRGIPSIVVIEALERGFEKAASRGSRKRPINSLSYFRHIVEDCWESFQESRLGKEEKKGEVGKGQEIDPEKMKEYLSSLSRALGELSEKLKENERISSALRKSSRDLDDLLPSLKGEESDAESLEERLASLDEELGEALLQGSDPGEIEKARRGSEEELSRISSFMNQNGFEEIKKRSIYQKLRKKHGIPRISLFFH